MVLRQGYKGLQHKVRARSALMLRITRMGHMSTVSPTHFNSLATLEMREIESICYVCEGVIYTFGLLLVWGCQTKSRLYRDLWNDFFRL